MSDWELLQQYLHKNSQPAMCQLVQRHIDMVHATALRALKDPHLADDVTQAVFLILIRRAPSLSPRIILGGWLFKTTLFAVKDAKRQQSRRQHHEQEAAKMTPAIPPAETPDILPLLNDTLAELPAADRSAIVLRYLEGRPTADLALALGTSENTARQRLARALEKLRKKLSSKGLFIAAAALTISLDNARAPAAPASIAKQVQSFILQTTVPPESIQLIAKGALQLMRTTQLKAISLSTAALLMLAAGTYVAFAALGSPPASPAASATPASTRLAASAPATTATAKFGPAKTPKGTVLAAFQAAQAGDEPGFASCFGGLTDELKTSIHGIVVTMHTLSDLGQAVGDKYGEPAKAAFGPMLTMGVVTSDIEKAPEKIEANQATLDIGTGPGTIPLVKVGEFWLVSMDVFKTFNAASVADADKRLAPVRTIIADIRAGKYPNPTDLQPILMKALQDYQSGNQTPLP